jgi:hypothetical protein
LLRVVYRKYPHMRHQHKCNAWGAKSNHAQLNHINHFKPFTKLLLAFFVF